MIIYYGDHSWRVGMDLRSSLRSLDLMMFFESSISELEEWVVRIRFK